ncbi:hypothetical protein MPRM_01320 [Mycobacterium parmense]|uniref:Uncharacterized protein n=1 Tax=Mycobacterium parmense TaxID=185642 RepID=A0A7I7YPZ5_9MYCO|nr:hypothetical protein MPRM_01320 [Mycobacterium parmense]
MFAFKARFGLPVGAKGDPPQVNRRWMRGKPSAAGQPLRTIRRPAAVRGVPSRPLAEAHE